MTFGIGNIYIKGKMELIVLLESVFSFHWVLSNSNGKIRRKKLLLAERELVKSCAFLLEEIVDRLCVLVIREIGLHYH